MRFQNLHGVVEPFHEAITVRARSDWILPHFPVGRVRTAHHFRLPMGLIMPKLALDILSREITSVPDSASEKVRGAHPTWLPTIRWWANDKAVTHTPYCVTIYNHVAHSLGNINAIPQYQRNAQYSRKT